MKTATTKEDSMTAIDNTYRIGRCNYCYRRPVYAWKANTGLRLDDVRCPKCAGMLDRTSREARLILRLTDEQVATQRAAAIVKKEARRAEFVAAVDAWQEAADLADNEREQYRCELSLRSYERAEEEVTKELKRLKTAAAKEA